MNVCSSTTLQFRFAFLLTVTIIYLLFFILYQAHKLNLTQKSNCWQQLPNKCEGVQICYFELLEYDIKMFTDKTYNSTPFTCPIFCLSTDDLSYSPTLEKGLMDVIKKTKSIVLTPAITTDKYLMTAPYFSW